MKPIFVHETAVVDNPADLGPGVKVWHFTHVADGAVVGEGTTLGQNVFVARGAIIGRNAKVQNNVSIFDGVVIEDDVFIGPGAVFTNVKTPRAHINRKDRFEKTLIKKGASIGANATIICGRTIGEYAMIGAGCVVTRNVGAHALTAGNPALRIGWVCKCGCRLSEDMTCPECKIVYCLDNNDACFELNL